MQNQFNATIKNKNHWELQLLYQTQLRLNNLLTQLEVDPWTIRKINSFYKSKITKDNIIPISSHSIRVILMHLLQNDLDFLINNSTIETEKQ